MRQSVLRASFVVLFILFGVLKRGEITEESSVGWSSISCRSLLSQLRSGQLGGKLFPWGSFGESMAELGWELRSSTAPALSQAVPCTGGAILGRSLIKRRSSSFMAVVTLWKGWCHFFQSPPAVVSWSLVTTANHCWSLIGATWSPLCPHSLGGTRAFSWTVQCIYI